MKRFWALMLLVLAAIAAGASAETYTQADLDWADGVTDQAALPLRDQAKYLEIQKQRQGDIALLTMGEADTPFLIADGAQLAELAVYVNAGNTAFNAAHYVLTRDVDVSAYSNWTPIGAEDQPFMGVFDGQNHTVTGLKIDRSDDVNQGLFGCVNSEDENRKAQIKNVIVKDAKIRARAKAGAVVGSYGGGDLQLEPLENCAMVGGSIEGCADTFQASGIGGVVGLSYADVRCCYSTGAITVPQWAYEFGGVAGGVWGNVQNCYAAGSMTIFPYSSHQISDIGGLVGMVTEDVSDCYSTVDVVGLGSENVTFGGVVGTTSGSVTRCYATGNVNAYHSTGSIVGYVSEGITNCVALGSAVSGNVGCGRIGNISKQNADSAKTNYAWASMQKNTGGYPTDSSNPVDGDDLTFSAQSGLSKQFEAVFGGNSAWTYTENGLPTLKNVGGAQSSELPVWIRSNVVRIYTAADLAQLAAQVNSGDGKLGVLYQLMTDIDLSGQEWTPIGTKRNPFRGVFDGQGHTITGLTITGAQEACVGLFGNVYGDSPERKAQIRNVIIKDAQVTAMVEGVGSLAGYYNIYTDPMENCAMIGGSVRGKNYVGGLVGAGTSITNCYATGSVVGTEEAVGGLMGYTVSGTVTNCYATGSVSGQTCVGGITGILLNNSTIANCYATGSVTGENAVGGVVGYFSDDVMRNCAALSPSVSGNGGEIRRISGQKRSGKLSGNYAWSDMKVNGSPVTDDDAAGPNGAALSYNAATGLSTQFETIFGRDDAWTYTENGLPILKNVGGTQSSALPGWLISSESVVYIYTAKELKQLADEVNAGNSKSGVTYRLANDIDLAGQEWTPIGTEEKPFSGVFDGQGHTVTGLKITGTSTSFGKGLFGYVDGAGGGPKARIWRVKIQNAEIDTRECGEVGALVGWYGGNTDPIEACAMIGGSVSVDNGSFVGGLVGRLKGGTMQNCYATGSVQSRQDVGGLVGLAWENAKIQNCYATGSVQGEADVGGLAGYAFYAQIQSCYAAGEVTGSSSSVGGLVGGSSGGGTKDCVAMNPKISGQAIDKNRMIGHAWSSTSIRNNYAWARMKVGDDDNIRGYDGDVNGGNVLASGGLLYYDSYFYNDTPFPWRNFDTNIWDLRSTERGRLPSLRMGDDPVMPLEVQRAEIRYAVKLTAGEGVAGFRYKVNGAGDFKAYTSDLTVALADKLEIEPILQPGYEFDRWSDGKTGAAYVVDSMKQEISLTANARAARYQVTIQNSYAAAGEGRYTAGTTVTIDAGTLAGHAFDGWTVTSGRAALADAKAAQTTFVMPGENVTLTAKWKPEKGFGLPQTGDDSRALLWGAMLAVCAAGLAALSRKKR